MAPFYVRIASQGSHRHSATYVPGTAFRPWGPVRVNGGSQTRMPSADAVASAV